jgi:NAD(P)-dependent dehydrogenase (short-subunit alcohol dehydrogenase family)
MVSLQGKVVVITGASSGIGKAAAIAFAEKGSKVVMAARRKEKLDELAKSIDGICLAVKADVTKEEDVKELFSVAENSFGKVDVLVNNVGKGLKLAFYEISFEEWSSIYATNVDSVFMCTKEAAKLMMRKKVRGHIITVSSLAGIFNIPGCSSYCSSKHAVSSFKRSIRMELWKHGIKTSTIHPYKVDTEFFDSYAVRPRKAQMLLPMDVAAYMVALAERNHAKIASARIANVFKRTYYLLRYLGR